MSPGLREDDSNLLWDERAGLWMPPVMHGTEGVVMLPSRPNLVSAWLGLGFAAAMTVYRVLASRLVLSDANDDPTGGA